MDGVHATQHLTAVFIKTVPNKMDIQALPSMKFNASGFTRIEAVKKIVAGLAVTLTGRLDLEEAKKAPDILIWLEDRISEVLDCQFQSLGTTNPITATRYRKYCSLMGILQSRPLFDYTEIFKGLDPADLNIFKLWGFFLKMLNAIDLTETDALKAFHE